MSVQAMLIGQKTEEATTSKAGLMSASDKTKLNGIAQGATANTGTITGIKMNGSSKGTSGVVDLGTVLTAHQDISGKENTSNKVTSISASSTDTQYPSAKAVYNELASIKSYFYSFDWGDESATADADWFAKLKAYVALYGADESWVGKTKSVTLTTAVRDATTHLIRCIGVNQDGDKTVTFQTKNCLPTSAIFSSTASNNGTATGGPAYWNDTNCLAKKYCVDYYNAFPGKASIKVVSKGTNETYNASSLIYTNETVWLPSIFEVGLGSYSYAPKAAEYTNGCSTPYSYYADNTSRIKYEGDSSSQTQGWWTRSRFSGNTSSPCCVYGVGSAGYNYYSTDFYLAPAFVIG